MSNNMDIDKLMETKAEIDKIIKLTNWNMLVDPNVTITFIEAKARLMDASKKFAKIITLMEKST